VKRRGHVPIRAFEVTAYRSIIWKAVHILMTGEPHVALGLVPGQIVENDMDMAVPIGGADLVHEIEEFDPPASSPCRVTYLTLVIEPFARRVGVVLDSCGYPE
jgi:hypothetical protein